MTRSSCDTESRSRRAAFGALVEIALHQGERPALIVLYVAGRDLLGGGRLGLAFPDRALPVGAQLSDHRMRAAEIDREGWQIIELVMRWLPDRTLVFVADSSFAAWTIKELLMIVIAPTQSTRDV